MRTTRGQSSIIGVAVLLAVTALSLGVLTAAAGTMIEGGVTAADASRVADDLAHVDTVGPSATRIEFSSGTFSVVPRSIRLLQGEVPIVEVEADAFVYETGSRQATLLGGTVVRKTDSSAQVTGPVPVVAGDERVLVDVVALNATGTSAAGGTDPTAVTVRTDPSHSYQTFDAATYGVAIETESPGAWERAFEGTGTVAPRQDFDDDGVPSVVIQFSGEPVVDFAIHDLRAVVRRG